MNEVMSTQMQVRYERLLEEYQDQGQSHVFGFWDELSEEKRAELIEQLENIDLEKAAQLASGDLLVKKSLDCARTPAPVLALGQSPDGCTLEQAFERGEALLRRGKVLSLIHI